MDEPIIKLKQINKSYGHSRNAQQILHDISLEIFAGELVAIVGTSGSGKTTLLNLIGGLDMGFAGEAVVAGRQLSALRDRELSQFRNEKIGFVFQHFNLLEHLSCLENVALPYLFSRDHEFEPRQRAREVLARVGMDQRADDLPTNLSGGQKQRVAIARALFHRPTILLCDEPTGNLDSNTGQQIIDLFTSLNRDDKITLIIVTHESRVSRAANRVLRLEDGRVVAQGTPEQVEVTGIGEG